MADTDKHDLPSTSYDELKKLIIGFSHLKEPVKLDAAAKAMAVNKFRISKNNGFLTDTGLIVEGQKKKSTPLGTKLGRALEHNHDGDKRQYLSEAISSNEFLSSIITTLRIQSGMKKEDLEAHVLYASEQNSTKDNKTGSRTVVDMLLDSGLVSEDNGKIVVAKGETPPKKEEKSATKEDASKNEKPKEEKPKAEKEKKSDGAPLRHSVSINVNLQLPDNPDSYEEFFKMFKKYILDHAE